MKPSSRPWAKRCSSLGGYNLGVFKGAPEDQQKAAAVFGRRWATPAVAAKWTSISNYMPGIQAVVGHADAKELGKSANPRRRVGAVEVPYGGPRSNFPSDFQLATGPGRRLQSDNGLARLRGA